MDMKRAASQLKRAAKEYSEARAEIINDIYKSLHDAGIEATLTYRGDISHAVITIDLTHNAFTEKTYQVRVANE